MAKIAKQVTARRKWNDEVDQLSQVQASRRASSSAVKDRERGIPGGV